MFEPGGLRLPRRRRHAAWKPTRSSGWPRAASSRRTATTASGSAWTRCATSACSRRCGQQRPARRGRCGHDRRRRCTSGAIAASSSPAATGLVGGWLVRRSGRSRRRRRLPRARLGAAEPSSIAVTSLDRRARRARRRPRPGAARARARRVRDRHRHPSGGADDRRRSPIATRSRRSRPTSAAPGRCSRPAAAARPSSRSCVASSDKAYGDHADAARTTKTTPLQGEPSLRREQVVRRPDRADRTRTTYGLPVAITRCGNFFGGGDLNWNRIVPGTIRSVAARRAADHPLGRHVRPRLLLRRGRRRGLHAAGRSGWRQDPTLAGEAFNFSTESSRSRAASSSSGSSRLMDSPRSSRSILQRGDATRFRTQYPRTPTKAREMLGWPPLFSLDEGLDAHDRLVPRSSCERRT